MQAPQLRYTTDQAPTILRYHNSARVGVDGVERATKLRGIGGPPGCVVGSTVVHYRRGKRNSSRKITISKLLKKFYNQVANPPRGSTHWDSSLTTYLYSYSESTGVIYANELKSVQATGRKQCWRVSTESHGSVDITAEDSLLLVNGTYRKVSELKPGDVVLARGSGKPVAQDGRKKRPVRKTKTGLKYYKGGWIKRSVVDGVLRFYRVQHYYVLVAEAKINKVQVDTYIRELKTNPNHGYADPINPDLYDVHHIDCNPYNDAPDNLQVLTKEEHREIHKDISISNLNVEYTVIDKITSIKDLGMQDTFDCTMVAPDHNFVVNDGLIKHNSGKSVGAAVEHLHFLAQRQQADNQGRRRTKVAIIRSTYRKLQRTTHKTVTEWIMPGSGTIPNTAPMRGELNYAHPSGDGTTVNVIVEFMAIETLDDLQNMDSLEVSSIYINEANEQLEQIISASLERVGRYPPPKDGVKCTEPCVSVDFNLPGKEHWLHKLFIEKDIEENEFYRKTDIEYFEQPAAVLCPNYEAAKLGIEEPVYQFNPAAENLANLPEGYYGGQLATNSWPRIQSRLMMQWVTPNTGKRIHDDFKGQFHKSPVPIPVERGAMVFVGFDTSGQNKGFSFCQYIAGQVRVLREAFHDGGTVDAIDKVLKPMLSEHFPECPVMLICDPANPKDDHTSVTATSLLKNEGYNAIVAPGKNKLQGRINAISTFLKRVQGFIVSPEAPMIIAGFETQYVYKLDANATKTLGKMVYTDQKQDNDWAHYIDATQNVCLYLAKANHLTQHNAAGMAGHGTIRPKRVM